MVRIFTSAVVFCILGVFPAVATSQPVAVAERTGSVSRLAGSPHGSGHTQLPDGLYPALIKAEQRTTSSAYRVHALGGSLVAHNPTDHFGLRFDASGAAISFSSSPGVGALHIRFVGVSYAGSLPARDARSQRLTKLHPAASGQRVTYDRGPIQEWYVNGPAGLEQGFTLAKPPVAHGSGPLKLMLHIQGARHARLTHGSVVFTLAGSRGSPDTTLRYGDLYVHDATGRRLTGHLALRGVHSTFGTGQPQGIAPTNSELITVLIVIDDRGAHYPLTIDPTITPGTQFTLTAPSVPDPGFDVGSLAISGDGSVALVAGANAAYIFTKPATGWANRGSPTATLTDSSGSADAQVALNGDGSIALMGVDVNGAIQADVFVEPSSGWSTTSTPAARLTDDSPNFDGTGEIWSMALSGDGSVALVGMTPNANSGSNIANVFTEPSAGWQTATSPTATLSTAASSGFGHAVALNEHGTAALIGDYSAGPSSNGRSFVYVEPGGGWVTTATPNATLDATAQGAYGFGIAVALSGDGATALVGSWEDLHGFEGGFIFTATNAGWAGTVAPTASLTDTTSATHRYLGDSVSLSGGGDIALIGAPGDNTNPTGVADIFREPGGPTGTWKSTSTADEVLSPASGSGYGGQVGLSGDGSITLVGTGGTGGGVSYVQATSSPLYVNGNSSVGGSDTSNTCTDSTKPCLTIAHALTQAPSGATINIAGPPSANVAGGFYCERLSIPVSVHLQSSPSLPATIDGGGPGTLCTAASTPAPVISVGAVGTAATHTFLSLGNLTIQHGGGALLAPSSFGGGILNSGGTLYLSRVAVTGNTATSQCAGSAQGGGIVNLSDGSLFLDQVTVSGNTAQGGSGGLQSGCSGGSGLGGGVGNFGTMLLRASTVENNKANGGGGGRFGGLGGAASGGGIELIGALWVIGSTIDKNQANGGGSSTGQGGSANGGGIDAQGTGSVATPLLLANTTVTGNSIHGGSSSISAAVATGSGGGLSMSQWPYTLINDTITGNAATGGGGGNGSGGVGSGGGVYGPSGQTAAQLTNTILTANTAATSNPDCSGSIRDTPLTPAPVGHNIVGVVDSGCTFSRDALTDQIGVDPELDTNGLQNNGGPTRTIALQQAATPPSPAIGAGSEQVCASLSIVGSDQRGVSRRLAQRNTCDIGAYDTGQNVTLHMSAPSSAAAGQPIAATLTAVNAVDGTTATGYAGAMHLTASDSTPTSPADYTLQDHDVGVHIFSGIVFNDAGPWSLQATDAVTSLSAGTPVQVGVAIVKGWNLLDIPLQGTGIPDAAGLANCIDGVNSAATCTGGRSQLSAGAVAAVATYADGRFQVYVPNFSSSPTLSPVAGIFVLSNTAGTWLPAGSPYDTGQTVTLTSGWNLVAAPFPLGGNTAGVIAGEIPGGNAKEVAIYTSGSYRTWTLGHTDFGVSTYNGMWILCQSGTTWTPS